MFLNFFSTSSRNSSSASASLAEASEGGAVMVLLLEVGIAVCGRDVTDMILCLVPGAPFDGIVFGGFFGMQGADGGRDGWIEIPEVSGCRVVLGLVLRCECGCSQGDEAQSGVPLVFPCIKFGV